MVTEHRIPVEIEELTWYYRESAAEVGLQAQQLRDCASGEAGGPSAQQMAAARRQYWIRRALAALSSEHRAALEACYEARRLPPELVDEYGIGAGAIHRATRVRDCADRWAHDRVVATARRSHAASRRWHEARAAFWAAAELRGYTSTAARRGIVEAQRAWQEAQAAAKATRAARTAERAARATTEAVPARTMRVVWEAHAAYRAMRQRQRRQDDDELAVSRSEARARRLSLLEECRKASGCVDERVARVAAWLREMGVV